jgi:rhodanese-related sulfurtransferase
MKRTSIGMLLLVLFVGNAHGESLNGQFLFHSKDGKVVGVKSQSGLVALNDGQKMQIIGAPSFDSLKTCDEVETSFSWSGKQRVINAVTLKKGAESTSCDLQAKPMPVARLNSSLADKSAMVLDVRSAEEYAKSHLDGAINLPVGEIEAKVAELPKDKPIIIYCHSGRRAAFASLLLQEKGVSASFVKGRYSVIDGKPQVIE